jgi:hypothetical protein
MIMKVENREVDDELYQLRVVEGRTWHDIGRTVGMSHEGARKKFHRNLGRGITDEDREQYRAGETEKLDHIEATYLEIAGVALARGELRPVFSALDGRLKCHRERAKINGLAQPVRVELQTTLDDVEKAFDAYMQGIADRNGSALNGAQSSA